MNTDPTTGTAGPVAARVGSLPHLPALDGLRGLAVAAVVVLHAGGRGWLPGGFLGVSLFFTLSGYLIGSLVLAEVEAGGRLDLRGFWARRVRRLIPALVLTVIGVAVLSRFIELPSSTRNELLGGLGYVANWVQVAGGESYADLFETPSAAIHLWSLAIEEQFYLVFPFAAWLLARRVPGGLRRAYVAGGLAVVAVGVLWASQNDDQVFSYYATQVRAPEIGVGLVMAGLWPMGHLLRGEGAQSASYRRVTAVVGWAALVVTLALWWTVSLSDEWIYSGGLAAVALVSAGLLGGAVTGGRLATVLAIRPLMVLGALSYGLYLYHWPVVVLLSQPRVDLATVPLFALRVAVSLALAWVSYRFFEQPIRKGRFVAGAGSGTVVLVGLAALVVAAAVVWVVVPTPADAPTRRPAPAVVAPPTADRPGPSEPEDVEVDPENRPGPTAPQVPVVAVLGDSVPNWMVRDGGWALDPAEVLLVDGTSEGCDGAEGSPVGRSGTGVVVTVPESCTGWRTQYPPVFEGHQVDVAVLVVGTGAVLDRRLDDEFFGPCTDVAAEWYRSDVVERIHYLGDHAASVVVVLPAWAEKRSVWLNPSDHLERTDCVRATLEAAIEESDVSPAVAVVDLAAHLCPDGPDGCRPVREEDGVHIDADEAGEVLAWLIGSALDARPADAED